MKPRTIVELPATQEFGTVLDTWAVENHYKLQTEESSAEGPVRVYQKGTGFLVAPMMLRVVAAGQRIQLEAWVRAGFFVRLISFFILPAEMMIESGGFRGVLPRKIARKAMNELLARLGANPIP
jgi:hypothetical protein